LSGFTKTKDKPYQPLENESVEQMNYLKKLWTVLNSDITPHLQTLRDNILDQVKDYGTNALQISSNCSDSLCLYTSTW
jgi:hypothetical protein